MTWKDAWEWLKFLAAVLGGMLIHVGVMIFRGGEKSHQLQVFGEDIREIKAKVDQIPKLESDMRAIRQALFDNGIKIANGGH